MNNDDEIISSILNEPKLIPQLIAISKFLRGIIEEKLRPEGLIKFEENISKLELELRNSDFDFTLQSLSSVSKELKKTEKNFY